MKSILWVRENLETFLNSKNMTQGWMGKILFMLNIIVVTVFFVIISIPYGTLRTGDIEDSDVEDKTLRTGDIEDRRH